MSKRIVYTQLAVRLRTGWIEIQGTATHKRDTSQAYIFFFFVATEVGECSKTTQNSLLFKRRPGYVKKIGITQQFKAKREKDVITISHAAHLSGRCLLAVRPQLTEKTQNGIMRRNHYGPGNLTFWTYIQGGSNMIGTDLYVNKPQSVPVIFEPPCTYGNLRADTYL